MTAMARRIIEDRTTSGSTTPATYVEDSTGPALGVIVGLIVGAAVVVLAILFATGTFDRGTTDRNPTTITNNNDGGTAPSSNGDTGASTAPSASTQSP
jgi:hypothetical protein